MKAPTFTEPYESKLKELKIKTRFVDVLRANLLEGETIKQACEYLNRQPSWACFIFGAAGDFTNAFESKALLEETIQRVVGELFKDEGWVIVDV